MYAAQLRNAHNATFNNEATHPTNLTGEDIALERLMGVGNTLWEEVLTEKTRRMAIAFQSAAPTDQLTIQTILNVPDVIQ